MLLLHVRGSHADAQVAKIQSGRGFRFRVRVWGLGFRV